MEYYDMYSRMAKDGILFKDKRVVQNTRGKIERFRDSYINKYSDHIKSLLLIQAFRKEVGSDQML
jgi:hypothetical protein